MNRTQFIAIRQATEKEALHAITIQRYLLLHLPRRGMFALTTAAQGATRIAASLAQRDVQETIDAAWAEATDLGTGDRAFFIEDNVFEATERSFALDGWKGQCVVVRHDTFKNALIGNHGTESSGRLRGARSFEIYDNVIQYTGTNWPDAIRFRSGTGVVFRGPNKTRDWLPARLPKAANWEPGEGACPGFVSVSKGYPLVFRS